MALSIDDEGRRSASPSDAAITGEDGVEPRCPGYHILREFGDPEGIELEPADGGPIWPEGW